MNGTMNGTMDYQTVELHGCITGLANLMQSDINVGAFPSVTLKQSSSPLEGQCGTGNFGVVIQAIEGKFQFVLVPKAVLGPQFSTGWAVQFQFGTIRSEGFEAFHEITLDAKNYNTRILVGNVDDVVKLLESAKVPDSLEFHMIMWHTEKPNEARGSSIYHELTDLRNAAKRLQITLAALNRSSVDITRLIFHSPKETYRYLYTPSHVLTQFDYFQPCHSNDFSETQISKNDINSTAPSEHGSDHRDLVGFDGEDSDAEWDIEDQGPEEANSAYKANIRITDISRRTFKAFIDYASCGALHFAPLHSAYDCYVAKLAQNPSQETEAMTWKDWANANCVTHARFGAIKTLTSPKSMYRLADKFMIPELKASCYQQIQSSLQNETVVQEINSLVFKQHEDLLASAYKYVCDNWDAVVKEQDSFRIIENVPTSTDAKLLWKCIFSRLTPKPEEVKN